MASARPMANSTFVGAPHSGYPEVQGGVCQVPPYPSNQPQVHFIPVIPPGLKSPVIEHPAQRTLKDGKALGFIVSGSLSVSAENQPKSSHLLNSSLGLNIVSAVCSVVGITLFIMDMSLSTINAHPDYYPPYDTWGVTPGVAISGVLLIFCLLEFCVACASSHLGCQLVCCQHNVGVVLPNVYMTNPVVVPEPVNLPPTYSNEVQGSR